MKMLTPVCAFCETNKNVKLIYKVISKNYYWICFTPSLMSESHMPDFIYQKNIDPKLLSEEQLAIATPT